MIGHFLFSDEILLHMTFCPARADII